MEQRESSEAIRRMKLKIHSTYRFSSEDSTHITPLIISTTPQGGSWELHSSDKETEAQRIYELQRLHSYEVAWPRCKPWQCDPDLGLDCSATQLIPSAKHEWPEDVI